MEANDWGSFPEWAIYLKYKGCDSCSARHTWVCVQVTVREKAEVLQSEQGERKSPELLTEAGDNRGILGAQLLSGS